MTTTVPHVGHAEIRAFAEERVNLHRDDVDDFRAQVNRLRERLENHIREHPDYGLVKMLHSGSVAKGTALRTLNDMDVAVYVRSSAAPHDERDLLNWLGDRLREVYTNMAPDQIQSSTHCVTVRFSGSGLKVDVAPVIHEGEADDRGYLIVKDTGARVLTSISLHLRFIRARKDIWPDHYAQVVRLMKWWVKEQKARTPSFRFKSFVAELLCTHLGAKGVDFSDYSAALERIFAYVVSSELRERISFTDYYKVSELPAPTWSAIEIFDPVNPNNNVTASYTDADRRAIVEAGQDALDSVTEARYATTKARAVERWQEVLGTSFKG
jgi:tRNA nucleotidyltransferase (CCA-adding enzyme)